MADLTPNNREEHWLKGMVDGSTTLTPNKRQEYWYQEIINAQGGGGGGTGGGFDVVVKSVMVTPMVYEFSLISGDFSSAKAKMLAHQPVIGVLHQCDDDGEGTLTDTPTLFESISYYENDDIMELFWNDGGASVIWTASGIVTA